MRKSFTSDCHPLPFERKCAKSTLLKRIDTCSFTGLKYFSLAKWKPEKSVISGISDVSISLSGTAFFSHSAIISSNLLIVKFPFPLNCGTR